MNTIALWNNGLANRIFDNGCEALLGNPAWNTLPGTRIEESEDAYTVEVDMPGVSKGDIKMRVEGSELSVVATRSVKRGKESKEFRLSERFTLPEDADTGSIQAALKDGVLAIRLNKREEAKPREIEIQVH